MSRFFVICAIVLLTGCAAADPVAAPSPSSSSGNTESKERQRENMKADCMKQKGFKYVAWVPEFPEPTAEERQAIAGDYAAMRKEREKYGHFAFSGFIYPKDPKSGSSETGLASPNNKYMKSLSPTQMNAYNKAEEDCFRKSVKTVLGRDVKGIADYFGQYSAAIKAAQARELDGDPDLIPLAQAYGDCLKSKGYPVATVKPSKISTLESERFFDMLWDLGREQYPQAKEGENYQPQLSPAQAKPYFTKEVKSALDDLECGKDYFPVYNPKQTAVLDKVAAEYGFSR